MAILSILRSTALYFALVFGAGFLLGPIRVLWLEPQVGVRPAELIEAPIMLLAIVLAGRWLSHRPCATFGPAALLAVGLLTSALILGADLVVGIQLRGLSAAAVFSRRDPVSGSVYDALVALTALMPWLWRQLRWDRAPDRTHRGRPGRSRG